MSSITHTKVVSEAEAASAAIEVGRTEWNDGHVISGSFIPRLHGNESHSGSYVTIDTLSGSIRQGLSFAVVGNLTSGSTNVAPILISPATFTIVDVLSTVKVAPSGSPIIIDINKNGTTIFGTQSARPSIQTGSYTGSASGFTVDSLDIGDLLTIDIDQNGSSNSGSGLTVMVCCEQMVNWS
jgi:hypothetical protein